MTCPNCSEPHMVKCPRCGGETINHRTPGVVECAECQAREAFGEMMPRIVVQPHSDRRFVVVSVEHGNVEGSPDKTQFVVDRALARMLGTNLVSIT